MVLRGQDTRTATIHVAWIPLGRSRCCRGYRRRARRNGLFRIARAGVEPRRAGGYRDHRASCNSASIEWKSNYDRQLLCGQYGGYGDHPARLWTCRWGPTRGRFRLVGRPLAGGASRTMVFSRNGRRKYSIWILSPHSLAQARARRPHSHAGTIHPLLHTADHMQESSLSVSERSFTS